ncbi:MAG: UDP-N-acetylmuramate dehydrogenase, partial [Ginsengibacter sp.]
AFARFGATFTNLEELKELKAYQEGNIEQLILGGGSNVLFTENYDGIVLINKIPGIEIIKENEEYIFIKVGAGISWNSFVEYCVKNNYAGVENLSLIPGNTGASPMQNIGAYGVEIKDVFHELEAYHLKENYLKIFTAAECEFGYRESIFKKKFKNQFAILNVTYRLNKKPVFHISYHALEQELSKQNIKELSIQAIAETVISIRRSKLPDPNVLGNAGSFFKNPVISKEILQESSEKNSIEIPHFQISDDALKVPAGWVIEHCGWKGYRNGDAGCYEKQALVLVNYGNAKGKEIFDLSEEIIISVNNKFGINLEREVNILP